MGNETKKNGVLVLGTGGRRLDAVAAVQGIEKECPWRSGLHVKILPAATFNPRFREAIANLQVDEAEVVRARKVVMGDDRARAAASAAFISRWERPDFAASALVGDMRGIYAADGSEVAYTEEVGLKILSDPSNADVLQWIVGEAMQIGQFYTKAVEADAKNSRTGSGGKRTGAGRSRKTKPSKAS